MPRANPRPETYYQDYGLQGFTEYPIWTGSFPVAITTKAQVLAQIATLSGVPTPSPLNDHSTTLGPQLVAQNLMGANPSRSWLAIYNPGAQPFAISIDGTAAVLGAEDSIDLGFGGALFWATAQQGAQPVYTGAISIVGNFAGRPVWAWDF